MNSRPGYTGAGVAQQSWGGFPPPPNRACGLLVFNMAKVEIGEYRAQDAHYGLYQLATESGDIVIVRRKVGEPTDYLHPNSPKVKRQRENFGLASTHYSHLTPIQKMENRLNTELVEYSRGSKKSGTKVLTGRQLFISKDIHSLNELQKHIPSYLQICIALTDQELNLIEGDIRLYGLFDSEWREEDRRQLGPSHWLFPTVPRDLPLYHPVGADYDYYDPEDPQTTYLTLKELMLYHYHKLSPRPTITSEILRPNAAGYQCLISNQIGEPCPDHWKNVDEEVHDGIATSIYHLYSMWTTDLYNIADPTTGVYDPKKVTIRAVVRRESGYAYARCARMAIRTHDQTFIDPTSPYLFEAWQPITWELEKNPATNDYWTLDEIADLQIGIDLRTYLGVGWYSRGWCTQLYAKVEYYAPL